MLENIDILLIYPRLGTFDKLICDIPLSLIYAAADSVKCGLKVKILDLRLCGSDWKQKLDSQMKAGCGLVGVSVMTGNPIATSLEIAAHLKATSGCPIVWGGPHPTILPEQTLENPNVDYVIRDAGSKALMELALFLKNGSGDINAIRGLGYKRDGKIVLNPPVCNFEIPNHLDIPYDLVKIDSDDYSRSITNETAFPIFTSMGCPYKCTFCMSPLVYEKINGKKWVPIPVQDVIAHIAYVAERYKFNTLQIYDDDSFVDLDRMRQFFALYMQRGFHNRFRLDFRGARINELDRMDDAFLDMMRCANVHTMAIGVESGSQASLDRINKGITVKQIIDVNKKLARYPSMQPHYNFFCGIPGETLADLKKTKDLLLTLLRDNPNCYLGVGADWKPLPGSVMTDRAVEEYGLHMPDSLAAWSAIDSVDAKKIRHPWYSDEMDNYIKLLQLAGRVLDKKAENLGANMVFPARVILLGLIFLYRKILRLRLKHDFSGLLIEYNLKSMADKILMGVFKKIHHT